MTCPYCGFERSKVVDSRPVGNDIRRRRECLWCDKRFTTYEIGEGKLLAFLKSEEDRRRTVAEVQANPALCRLPEYITTAIMSELEHEALKWSSQIIATILPRVIGSMIKQNNEATQ